ncbi:phytoene/squalene synthase family protein [Halostella sp. JP-L12]|uniref:phytoene/squalene synthase family protein n=1 Tax=Halostella TaxID=1843185 RepID=UPI000EF7C4F9|nr:MULTISPECIES: phytoene/squalene synthase family protein [Halostella]NHN47168.1 phytoene/squalene synthase family protein [Halostella sp. JP-L12]
MARDRRVAKSKAIQRRTGKTFHFATRVLPERVRHPTYVLYAFFRIADEVVDDAEGVPPEEQAARLEELREEALGRAETDSDVMAAFQDVREERGVQDGEINAFIEAMKTDIDKSRYETFDELRGYMRGSAAAVGAMMTSIMGTEDAEVAHPHAVALGEAFQMTNFLRDVREDVVDRDRIYLPKSTLDRHGATVEQVENLEFSPAFADAMRAELDRTERLYRQGVAGIQYLPEDCQFAVLLAAVLYADHHRLIRKLDYDVLSAEPSLGTARKVWLAARTRWHWQWNRDPVTVFRRVSALPDAAVERYDTEPPDPLPVP